MQSAKNNKFSSMKAKRDVKMLNNGKQNNFCEKAKKLQLSFYTLKMS